MAQLGDLAFNITANDLTSQALQRVKANIGDVTRVTKLSVQQFSNMQYQLQDIAVGLTSGQSPFTVLMQQGSQMAQMFQSGTGVRGALQAVGSGIVSFVTNPLNLAVLGFAAAAGAASLLWNAITAGGEDANKVTAESVRQIDRLTEAFKGAEKAGGGLTSVLTDVNKFSVGQQIVRQLEAVKSALSDFRTQFGNSLTTGLLGDNTEAQLLNLLNMRWDAEGKALVKNMQSFTTALSRQAEALADPLWQALVKDVREFRQAMVDGTADVPAFRHELLALANTDGATQALKDVIEQTINILRPADDAAEALRKLEAQQRLLEGTATDADRALLGLSNRIKRSGDEAFDALGPMGQYLGLLQRIADSAAGKAAGGGIVGSIVSGAAQATRMLEGAAVLARVVDKVLRPEVPGMAVPRPNPLRDLTSDYGVAEAHRAATAATREAAAATREYEQSLQGLEGWSGDLTESLFKPVEEAEDFGELGQPLRGQGGRLVRNLSVVVTGFSRGRSIDGANGAIYQRRLVAARRSHGGTARLAPAGDAVAGGSGRRKISPMAKFIGGNGP